MFTDLLNLSINRDRSTLQDQVLSLSGMTWEDYDCLTQEANSYRLSYLEGIITIVSPSYNHEVIERTISGLITAYCRKYSLPYFPMGSTTLKNPPLAGKEPDSSYSFDTRKPIADLAIEVVYSSGGTADLDKYKLLGVEEVWFWQNGNVEFYRLTSTNYQQIKISDRLPRLSSTFLINFINRGLKESPLTIEADFVQALPN
ncbi:Uma2 family endonuclease [Pleurocapsa sp. FMAR1]|uniref:Uma2 family endonuclease n=1 Tax=Pleurocapsa sp. FMAR1 TaxID=3040204 RepID=UPI0029C737C0|nr:Uma2 family endonuclease [Pleurocapsa sp. FMAR1]